jgi:hypothetical protein
VGGVDWESVAKDPPKDWRQKCKICQNPEASRGVRVLHEKGWPVAAIARKLSEVIEDFSCTHTPVARHLREKHDPQEG